jgi:hypothetical protein
VPAVGTWTLTGAILANTTWAVQCQ